jgi:hypothetical protein
MRVLVTREREGGDAGGELGSHFGVKLMRNMC